MVRRHRHMVPALIAAFLLGLVTIVPAAANNTAQPLPFSHDAFAHLDCPHEPWWRGAMAATRMTTGATKWEHAIDD